MKHIIQTLALCASMLWLATACQPEVPVGEPLPTYKLEYSVDNSTHTETLVGDPALDSLLRRLVVATGNGSRVHVQMLEFDGQAPATKETRTFVSDSEEEAVAWSRNMLKQGYDVEIVQKDGHYHCTALLLSNGVLTSLEGTTWFSHADEQLHFPGAGIYSDIHSVADYWITFEENTGMRIVEGETDMFGPDSLTETFSYTFDASPGRIVISDTYSSLSGQLSGEVEMVYDPEHSTIRWTHPMMDSVYHLVK